MTPVITPSPTLDPARVIHRLHRRLDFDLKARFVSDARECCAVAKFLSKELGTVPARALLARAHAVARFLEVSRYV